MIFVPPKDLAGGTDDVMLHFKTRASAEESTCVSESKSSCATFQYTLTQRMPQQREQQEHYLIDIKSARKAEPVPIRIQLFLCKYDVMEGISSVMSSAHVECVIGSKDRNKNQKTGRAEYKPYVPARVPYTGPPRGPVIIFAFHSNRPDLCRLQGEALKRFVLDEHVLVVIDDAQDEQTAAEMARAAADIGALHRKTPDTVRP